MRVLFVQDQEIYSYKGEYYHPKSKNYFLKFSAGLEKTDKLIVLCGIIELRDEQLLSNYKKISDEKIEYKAIPNFRNIKQFAKIAFVTLDEVKKSDFCYLRVGVASSFAGVFCRKYKKKYTAVLCEDIFKNTRVHRSFVVRSLSIPLWIMTRTMTKHANFAYYVTQEYLQKKYPCNGKILGCSDVEELNCDENELKARLNKINNLNRQIKIGIVGAVSVRLKGHDIAIKAISNLKSRGIDHYRLELVGGGNADRLKGLAKELGVENRVCFLGEKNRDDVLKWMNDIDIYIHPSRSEGLPRTILEAMSHATPCICTRVGGVPELIDQKWLFSPNKKGASEELANLIVKMNADEMKVEANKNFNKAKKYSPDILEKKILDFFEDNIGKCREKD